MQYATIILLVIACILLWRILTASQMPTANSNDWVILEWHELRNAGDLQKATWDSEAPLHLQFVPVIGWNCKNGKATPITPIFYHVWDRLNVSPLDKKAKYETLGYWIRDGAIFDIDDMRDSDLWERLYDYAFAGHDIKVHGDIPGCYRQKFSEIMEILVENRTKKHDQQKEDT